MTIINFFKSLLFINGLERILKLRKSLKNSEHNRLNINCLQELTCNENINKEMCTFIQLYIQSPILLNYLSLLKILLFSFKTDIIKAMIICGIDITSRFCYAICIGKVLDYVQTEN